MPKFKSPSVKEIVGPLGKGKNADAINAKEHKLKRIVVSIF